MFYNAANLIIFVTESACNYYISYGTNIIFKTKNVFMNYIAVSLNINKAVVCYKIVPPTRRSEKSENPKKNKNASSIF